MGGIGFGSTGWQENIPVLYATGVTTPPACASTSSGCYCVPSYTQSSQYTNFYLVMGDGRQYQFPHASFLNWQTTYTQTGGSCSSTSLYTFTQEEFSEDVLIDYDSHIEYGGYAGEGVMLDLSNAASGTGTVTVRFRDGSQILFAIPAGSGFTQPVCPAGYECGTPAAANDSPIAVPASALVDPNGNVISVSKAMGSTGVSVSGISTGGYPSSSTLTYNNSNGQPESIALNVSAFPVNSSQTVVPTWQTPAVGQQQGLVSVSSGLIINMLSSVVLPDNLAYTFQYNQYGELTEITYPSGGYTRYKYAAIPNANGYEWTSALSGGADRRVVIEKDTCPGQSTAPAQSGYYGTSTPPSTCSVPEEKTTYTNNGGYVAVVDPLGNETDYTFGGASCSLAPSSSTPFQNYAFGVAAAELSRKVYQGPASAEKFLRAVYSNYYSGCQLSMKTLEMTVLPNGTWSETTWSYDTALNQYYAPAIQDHNGTVSSWATAETDNMLVKSEYGFGPGPAVLPNWATTGNPVAPNLPLLRQTVNQYLATNQANGVNYQQVPVYILNRLQQQTVYNGSDTQVAQTTYTYDSYTGGIATTGAVQHGTSLNSYGSSYTTRGNVTQVSKWTGNGTPPVTTSYQYDDAGNVLVKTDTAGNRTLYSFMDYWGNSECAPSSLSTEAFPTSITTAAGEKTTYRWNSCTGTMASANDTNSQTISFDYDLMDRRVFASYPDGGQTCLQYSDAQNSYSSDCPSMSGGALPIQIAMAKKMNSNGETDVSTTVLDGVSRVVQTQHNSDPWGVDYVNMAYDADGRVASVTNPFRASGESSDGTIQYQYDALGRKVIQIQQDGSMMKWCYDGVNVNSLQSSSLCSSNLGNQSVLGSWTDIADETGRHWQQTNDAAGRLVKVLEPNPTNSITAAPADETDYTYDALDDLTQVNQWGGSYGTAPDLQRTFSYDGIARLTSSSNPETGTISYFYLNSGGGLCSGDPTNVCVRTDAIPTTTTYSYDADNNLIGKSYSDSTPAATFVYQHGTGSSSDNANGRVIQEYAGSSSSPLASTGNISYDQMGRSVQEQQCVLGNCTTNPPTWSNSNSGCTGSSANPTGNELTRTYDCAGNLTSWSAGVAIPSASNPITLSAVYDPAGRLGELISSWSDANHPSTLFWAGYNGSSASQVDNVAPYGPAGLNTADLAYTSSSGTGAILVARNYDNRFRVLNEFDTSGPVVSGVNQFVIKGSEQSATTSFGVGSEDSTGSITLSGAEQSQPSSSGVGSAPGTGAIFISGSEQVAWISTPGGNTPVYDDGYISVTINGVGVASYNYGQGDTADTIGSSLASQINANSSVVKATGGNEIGLTSRVNGASTDYPFTVSIQQGSNANLFSGPSFSLSPSGSTLTGGANGTLYDTGTVTLTANGHSDSASYGQGSTTSTIASTLASAVNGDGAASVSAAASGATISLGSKQPGASTDWPVSTAIGYDTTDFNSPSFSATSGAMTGGQNGTTYDSGTVSVTAAGHTDSVSFGEGSTTSSIATALESAINNDSNAPVTVNYVGSRQGGIGLELVAKEKGPGAQVVFSGNVTYNSAVFSQSSYSVIGGLDQGSGGIPLYNYQLTYDLNGNVNQVQDAVTGAWTYQNDSLNRLVNGYTDNGYFAGTDSDGNGSLNVAWSIDLFGNNKGETFSAGPTGELSNMPLTQPIQLTFNGNNNRADQFAYDSAGRVKQDYLNRYLYDAEGRVCAAQSLPGGAITLYLYDAEGNRIAKGGGSGSFACVTASATASSFSPQKWFILDGAEQQMTEMDYGSGAWQWAHSDVFAGSKLLATYCATGTAYCNTSTPTTFALSDWLGTKRVEATAAGGIDGNGQDTYASLPYGDQEFNGTGATEHFYTGKERDTESGNDYFMARYYSSAMGRFMSARLVSQSTARAVREDGRSADAQSVRLSEEQSAGRRRC